jgi:hypothetical protein
MGRLTASWSCAAATASGCSTSRIRLRHGAGLSHAGRRGRRRRGRHGHGRANGIFVFSHVGRWIDSRPLWNQHNYHVTNINDDWSVPISEPNSWELHNTYRTQTPDRSPAPAYQMVFTYTEGFPT